MAKEKRYLEDLTDVHANLTSQNNKKKKGHIDDLSDVYENLKSDYKASDNSNNTANNPSSVAEPTIKDPVQQLSDQNPYFDKNNFPPKLLPEVTVTGKKVPVDPMLRGRILSEQEYNNSPVSKTQPPSIGAPGTEEYKNAQNLNNIAGTIDYAEHYVTDPYYKPIEKMGDAVLRPGNEGTALRVLKALVGAGQTALNVIPGVAPTMGMFNLGSPITGKAGEEIGKTIGGEKGGEIGKFVGELVPGIPGAGVSGLRHLIYGAAASKGANKLVDMAFHNSDVPEDEKNLYKEAAGLIAFPIGMKVGASLEGLKDIPIGIHNLKKIANEVSKQAKDHPLETITNELTRQSETNPSVKDDLNNLNKDPESFINNKLDNLNSTIDNIKNGKDLISKENLKDIVRRRDLFISAKEQLNKQQSPNPPNDNNQVLNSSNANQPGITANIDETGKRIETGDPGIKSLKPTTTDVPASNIRPDNPDNSSPVPEEKPVSVIPADPRSRFLVNKLEGELSDAVNNNIPFDERRIPKLLPDIKDKNELSRLESLYQVALEHNKQFNGVENGKENVVPGDTNTDQQQKQNNEQDQKITPPVKENGKEKTPGADIPAAEVNKDQLLNDNGDINAEAIRGNKEELLKKGSGPENGKDNSGKNIQQPASEGSGLPGNGKGKGTEKLKTEEIKSGNNGNGNSSRIAVKEYPLSDIHTDTENFQNRSEDYSKETFDSINNDVKSGKFDISHMDPIKLWKDPETDKLFVVAGHSRLAAFKHQAAEGNKDFQTIPGNEISAKSLEDARIFAKEKSNVMGTRESDLSRANIYNDMRKKGSPEAEIKRKARELEKKNSAYIYNLSYLNPEGKTADAVKAFENSTSKKDTQNISVIADWIGDAKAKYPELTDAHENEMYDYLVNKDAYSRFKNKTEFLDKVGKRAESNYFNPEERLNLEGLESRPNARIEYDQKTKDLEHDLHDAISKRDKRMEQILEQNKDITPDEMQQKLDKHNGDVQAIQKELIEHKASEGRLIRNIDNQENMFNDDRKLYGVDNMLKEEPGKYEFRNPDDDFSKLKDYRNHLKLAIEEMGKKLTDGGKELIDHYSDIIKKRPKFIERLPEEVKNYFRAQEELRKVQKNINLMESKLNKAKALSGQENLFEQTPPAEDKNADNIDLNKPPAEKPPERQGTLFDKNKDLFKKDNQGELDFKPENNQVYKDKTDKEVTYGSAKEKNLIPGTDRGAGSKVDTNPSYRALRSGEQAYLERKYRLFKGFKFTAAREKVQSPEDVAYIFKQLEGESIEHTFALHVRGEGQLPIVQHISTGSYTQSIIEPGPILDAISRFGTKELYFVHNHPSGNIEASGKKGDIGIYENLKDAIPSGVKLHPGIIIDLKRGLYGLYDEHGSYSSDQYRDRLMQSSTYDEYHKKLDLPSGNIPLKALSFSRQVFNEDISNLKKVTGPEDVAAYVSAGRFTDGEKTQVIVLNNQNKIVGRMFVNSDLKADPKAAADEIALLVNRIGGTNAILVGNRDYMAGSTLEEQAASFKPITNISKELSNRNVKLYDYVSVKPDGVPDKMALENRLLEPDQPYKPGEQKTNQVLEPEKKDDIVAPLFDDKGEINEKVYGEKGKDLFTPKMPEPLKLPKQSFDPEKDTFYKSDIKPLIDNSERLAGVVKATLSKIPEYIGSIFQPAFNFEKQYGLDPSAEVIKGIHESDLARIKFDNEKLTRYDANYKQLENFFSKYPKNVIDAFNLQRGKPVDPVAEFHKQQAYSELPEELKDPRIMQAIKEVSDWNYNYAIKNGLDMDYFQDYFYGNYKGEKNVTKFIDWWKSTDKYLKDKTIPTIADALEFGLALKDPNPMANLRTETEAIAHRVGMKQINDYNMATKAPYMVTGQEATPDQRIDWQKVEDPVFEGKLFDPVYAKYVNSLLSTNKLSRMPVTNGLRYISHALQTVKFFGSIFHFQNMIKHTIAANTMGILNPAAVADFAKGFSKVDQLNPKYQEYVKLGGGHHYSIESETEGQMDKAIRGFANGDYLGAAGRTIVGGLFQNKWIPASPGFIKWMFQDFIPKLKFERFLKDGLQQEEKLGRPLTDGEEIQNIRRIQNFYGEMNERLFGRSGTVTSVMRLLFMAPGYGEGNFRTTFSSLNMKKVLSGEGPNRTNLKYVVNSLVATSALATLGTMIMTGKPPAIPTRPEDVRDLFKIKTGAKDGNGEDVYVDLMSFDKDFWSIYGNTLTGQFGKIPADMTDRVKNATGGLYRTMTDMSTIFQNKMVYDFKGDPVYYNTDPLQVKFQKFLKFESENVTPISASTFNMSQQKATPLTQSITSSIIGIRPTNSEKIKELKQARNDLFSMKSEKIKKQSELNKLANENPDMAEKERNMFNDQQKTKIENIVKNNQLPEASDIESFMINKLKTKVPIGVEEQVNDLLQKRPASHRNKIF
jgi:DNA repair protein RadC